MPTPQRRKKQRTRSRKWRRKSRGNENDSKIKNRKETNKNATKFQRKRRRIHGNLRPKSTKMEYGRVCSAKGVAVIPSLSTWFSARSVIYGHMINALMGQWTIDFTPVTYADKRLQIHYCTIDTSLSAQCGFVTQPLADKSCIFQSRTFLPYSP